MNPLIRTPALCAMLCPTLAGCYVLPYAPDGQPPTPYPYPYTYPYSGAPWPAPVASAPAPLVLAARLYPANELAARTGVLSGTVTNLMNGKGRFQLQLRGETLQGEATRVDGDQKRGQRRNQYFAAHYAACCLSVAAWRRKARPVASNR